MAIAASEVNQEIWHAVAGPTVKIPAVNSYVYYFPEGHLENSSSDYNYDGVPSIACRVISLRFLSTSSLDECLVKIRLQPVEIPAVNENQESDNNRRTDISYFVKVLSTSDAKQRKLVVPRSSADKIFPPLNLSDDLPAQNLRIRDAHNNAWEFRHFCQREMPSRHMFTTGWSMFVRSKGLVVKDSVVFMKRNSTGQLFVGIRRNARIDGDEKRNRIQVTSVTIDNAAKGSVFEVDYYPRDRYSDFVVSAARVQRSMSIPWSRGMKVKILVPGEGNHEGKIRSVVNSQNKNVQWRMLQVNWDDTPEILKDLKGVNPWEVECIDPAENLPQDPLLDSAPTSNSPPVPPAAHHQLLPENRERRAGKEPETVSHAPNTIGSSNYQRSATNVHQGQNSSTRDGKHPYMLFGVDIRTPEKPMEGGGSRNRETSDSTEEEQPNSSPDNRKGKDV